MDEYGKGKKLPRSAVRVNEDFHYMHGKYGCNDDSLCEREQSWQKRLIFNARNPFTQPLNVTLSMMCKDDIRVENLKECLFKDLFLLRSKFFEIRRGGKGSFFTNYNQYFCCECDYVKCNHFDDVNHLSQSSRDYYSDMCPVCVFKLNRPCYRTSDACCIKGMKKRLRCSSLDEADALIRNCYHFNYKRSYLNLCMEGNLFENAHRHVIKYFNLINCTEDFMTQQFKTLKLSENYVKKCFLNEVSSDIAMLNTISKSHANGAHCLNCKMQSANDCGINYVKIRPKMNKDAYQSQVVRRINVTPINDMSMRKIDLATTATNELYLNEHRR